MEAPEKLKKKLYGIIPKLPNAIVAGALRFMSLFDHLSKSRMEENRRLNAERWEEKYAERFRTGYIENQSELKDLKLGKSDMAYSGCEIIAVYNALQNLKDLASKAGDSLPGLISGFEKRGIILNGLFGTAPKALAKFFRKEGYRTVYTTNRKRFEALAKESEVFILTVYNDKKNILQEIHTICITKEPDGGYLPHNSMKCRESVKGMDELERRLGIEGRGKILAMTGICRGHSRFRAQEDTKN